ncbi:hypothetical protein ACH427_28090 [Streptomyces sp. NPDC020379]|uniref:hypothetical protein n=1 Tax=Streptomyces sp. NPDC020379 TaxID=3365071 RepID=UPI0037A9F39D
MKNTSEVQPTTVHADTQGQSFPVGQERHKWSTRRFLRHLSQACCPKSAGQQPVFEPSPVCVGFS